MRAFSSLSTLTESDAENTRPLPDDPAATPSTPTPKTPARTVKSTASSTVKTPRTSKKALAIAEQAERAAYAQSLFDDLNQSVFDGGLPATTTLVWSNRLLTTAGRAQWRRWVMRFSTPLCGSHSYPRRSKEGVHTTSIELATKILDSNGKLFFELYQRLPMVLIASTSLRAHSKHPVT